MTGTDARPVGRYALAERPSAQYPSVRYLAARHWELAGQLPGRAVADPYRWLADPANPVQAPVLRQREVKVENAARAVSRTVVLTTDELCFPAQYTGLDLEAVRTG